MAAGVTYEPIATSTSSGNNSGVGFSGFSSSYTDLVLTIYSKMNSGVNEYTIQFNGDSGQSYSYTRLYGTGSSAASSNAANDSTGITSNISNSASNPTQMIVNFQNYSNSTTYKTALTRFDDASAIVFAIVGLWRSTSAISTIEINGDGTNLSSGTTATLYGIL